MSNVRNKALLTALALATALVVAACSSQGTPAPEGTPSSSLATVETVDVLILESFPVQVQVVVRGTLPDACTTIDEVRQEREGDKFTVTITTARTGAEACTQALVPFEQNVALDVYGLPAGTYAVDVNGVTGSFTLAVDNEPQG